MDAATRAVLRSEDGGRGMRLIDADALIEAHYNYCNTHHGEADIFWTWSLRLMKDAPTIEAEPVRRGRWEKISPFTDTIMCSNCGYNWPTEEMKSNYCPDCGAKTGGREGKE